MAKKSMIAKANKTQKFAVRKYSRCQRCGRPRGYMKEYGICRICFRQLANFGEITGVRKASW